MSYQVFLTDDAIRDTEELYDYFELHNAQEKADELFAELEKTLSTLSENPSRGSYPKELLEIGLREYRQIFFNEYRIVYRIIAEHVYIMLIVDGRRDMQSVLEWRLLRA
jgi:toxin ParE1/3/4